MTTKEIIRYYAGRQSDQKFSRKGLLAWLQEMGLSNDRTDAAISLTLNRMLQGGELMKESWGTYSLTSRKKCFFVPVPSEEIRGISQLLNAEFPYTAKCVWNPEIVVPFMQHIPNLQVLIVEIERIAMEPAFNLLQGKESSRRVVFHPTSEDYAHYVSGFPSIIVKPLVSQSPLIDFGDISMPSLEKVMVMLTYKVFEEITSSDRPIVNVTQWCKQSACWDRMTQIDVTIPSDLAVDFLIDRQKEQSTRVAGRKLQKLYNGIQIQSTLAWKITKDQWMEIVQFIDDKHIPITDKERGCLRTAVSPSKVLSELQCKVLIRVLKEVRDSGYKGLPI